jgi:hypothetical protein
MLENILVTRNRTSVCHIRWNTLENNEVAMVREFPLSKNGSIMFSLLSKVPTYREVEPGLLKLGSLYCKSFKQGVEISFSIEIY